MFKVQFDDIVDERRRQFRLKFISYKFLNFFRAKVRDSYGIKNHDFSKKYQTTVRHAFMFGALAINRTM